MSLNTDTFKAEIILNGKQAQDELKKLYAEQQRLQQAQKSLYATRSAENHKAAAALQKDIDSVNFKIREQEKLVNGLNKTVKNLSNASYKELAQTVKILNKELRSGHVERNSKEWRALTERIRACRTEMKKMEMETQANTTMWQRFFKFLNDSWGGLTVLISSIVGASMTVRKTVQDYAEMEEMMADTRKYTGLTAEQVRDLNEDLKKMDTRTAREKLNELAGAAGRLGKTSKQDILDFVEAGNMIQVALGDDLGEGAIDAIGKLAMAFGEDEKKGLRGAMLATGSAVNELAQNSAAEAGYLVDFTARVGAFGKQLGLTQAQLMGFAAVMDEGLLRDEMAATAFGNMLTKMRSDTEKFARIAGMDVKEFARLLDEDANGAVLRLADNLKKQDPSTMMKMLDDMGLDGSRAVAVLATLADKIDDVRKHQQLATKAYEEGRSVINEYNTMNSTAQAELEKAKKKFHELSVELGEKLKPIVSYTISLGSQTVKLLSALTDFVTRNAKVLIYLTTVIATYTTVQKIRAMWENRILLLTKAQTAADTLANGVMKVRAGLLGILKVAQLAYSQVLAETTGNMKRAAAASRALNAAVASNPWGAALTAIVAFVGGLALVIDKVSELTDKERRLKEVNNAVSDGIEEEKTKLETLTDIIKSNASTEDERRRALEDLNGKLMEKHLGNLTEEAVRTGQASQMLERYLELKARELKMKALEQEIIESQKTLNETNRDLEAIATFDLSGMWKAIKMEDFLFGGLPATIIRNQLTGAAEQANIERLKKEMQAMMQVTPGTGGHIITRNEPQKTGGGTTPYRSAAETKKEEEERKKREAEERKRQAEEQKRLRERNAEIKAANDELLAMNMAMYAAGEINYSEYVEKQRQIQLAGIRKQMELYGEGTNEYKKLQLKEQQLLSRGTEEIQRMTLHDLERMHQILLADLEQQFNDANSSLYQNEEALNEALFQEEMDYLERKRDLYNKGSLERMKIEEEIEDLLNRHKLEKELRFQEQLESLRENYLGQTSEKRMTLELNALEKLHKAGLLKEEEYQQARLAIQARYATDPTQQTKDQFSNKASDAFTVAKQKAGDANTTNAWTGDVTNLFAQMDALKEMYKNDELTHAEYLAAKAMATEEFLKNVQEKYGTVFEGIGNLYNAASAYAKASSDYEVAVVTKNYDKQIEAAGNNQKKVQRLEKKKQEEIARIKSRANDRAMKMEIAQALASTAMGAINAYTSAAQVPLIGYILAPVAAAAALAAGMLQVATIKKQHQAEAAGYYEGGFTGGKNYRKQAGVVHEGEFVANHEAVNNKNLMPVLSLLDNAQRNNRVASLTMDDVARIAGGGQTSVVAPVVNVQTDNEELRQGIEQLNETNDMLREAIDNGIPCYMDTEKAYKALKHHENLLKNKG